MNYKYGKRDYINIRVKNIAKYIIDNEATVREAANEFGVSKSTVHMDMKYRLYILDRISYEQVRSIAYKHLDDRSINGGYATRLKYINGNQKLLDLRQQFINNGKR